MTGRKSELVYGKSVDAQDKFDYFIATVTGAIVTYSVQNYQPKVLSWNELGVEPLALIILFISFYLGIMRIQATVLVFRLNCDSLRAGETATDILAASQRGETIGIEPGTGTEFARDQFPFVYRKYKGYEVAANEQREKHSNQANTYYYWRNHLLITGFILLLLSKLLKPYGL